MWKVGTDPPYASGGNYPQNIFIYYTIIVISSPIEERLIEVKNCFCNLEPRVLVQALLLEISFRGFGDLNQENEGCSEDNDLTKRRRDSIQSYATLGQ